MRIARIPGSAVSAGLLVLAILALTSFADARGFMRGVGGNGGITGPFLTVTCPSTGPVSVASTNFTITYPSGTFNGTTNNITFSSVPAGTFTPAGPVVPTNVSTSTTFTFTPGATPQPYSITVANNVVVPVVGTPCTYTSFTPATGYTSPSPPTSGITGVPSTNFTITASPAGATWGTSQTVTVVDEGGGTGGGSFTPAMPLTMPNGSTASVTFTYTPAHNGSHTLTFSNGQAWTPNPGPLTYVSTTPATGYSVPSPPTSGTTGVASANFTITASPAGATWGSGQTITVVDEGGATGGGSFTPAMPLTMPNGTTSSVTFTYTPAHDASPHTLTFSNNQSWANAGPLPYTSTTVTAQNPLPLVIP